MKNRIRTKYFLSKKIALIIGLVALFTTIWQTARIYQEEIQLNDNLVKNVERFSLQFQNELNKNNIKIHDLEIRIKVLETQQQKD